MLSGNPYDIRRDSDCDAFVIFLTFIFIETRLYQINPIEILVQEDLTAQTEKLIKVYSSFTYL